VEKTRIDNRKKRFDVRKNYNLRLQHVRSKMESKPDVTPRGHSYKINIQGITTRAKTQRTPRGYAKVARIFLVPIMQV